MFDCRARWCWWADFLSGQPCSGVSSKDCDFIDVSLVPWLHHNEMGWDATLCLVLEPGGWLDLTISPVHLGRMQWTQQHASVGDRLFRLDRASKRVLDVKNTKIYWIKSRKTWFYSTNCGILFFTLIFLGYNTSVCVMLLYCHTTVEIPIPLGSGSWWVQKSISDEIMRSDPFRTVFHGRGWVGWVKLLIISVGFGCQTFQ